MIDTELSNAAFKIIERRTGKDAAISRGELTFMDREHKKAVKLLDTIEEQYRQATRILAGQMEVA